MDQQRFQRKLAAARELRLEVTETYSKIGKYYFQQFEIKNGEQVVTSQSFPIEKDVALEALEQMVNDHKRAAAEIQKKIDKLKALG